VSNTRVKPIDTWKTVWRRLLGIPLFTLTLPVFYIWALFEGGWPRVCELTELVPGAYEALWYGPYWTR
jgi:hypothetical protein